MMSFTRSISAASDKQRALTPGTAQQIIFAYGAEGAKTAGFPHGGTGGKKVTLVEKMGSCWYRQRVRCSLIDLCDGFLSSLAEPSRGYLFLGTTLCLRTCLLRHS